ncbi:MAG: hypothetical protein CGW95_09770, partial [Phenylobacterium zucineum]
AATIAALGGEPAHGRWPHRLRPQRQRRSAPALAALTDLAAITEPGRQRARLEPKEDVWITTERSQPARSQRV